MDLPQRIDDKRARAFTLLSSETVPADVREEQRERAIRVIELTEKLSSPTAFEAHLASSISAAYREAERGDRDEPRCTCGSPNCPILQGEVPSELRTRGLRETDTYRDATQFMMDHAGDPIAIAEALDEWHSLRAELYSEIELLHGALQAGREDRRRSLGTTSSSEESKATADD